MQFDSNDEIDPRSGIFRGHGFQPHDDHLTPIQYEYPWTRTPLGDPR
jgi:hypothetical protein